MTTGSVSIFPRSGPPGLEISGRWKGQRVSFEMFDNRGKAAAKSADKWAC
jgi:hypothetical protein